jgi:hypothetical protein
MKINCRIKLDNDVVHFTLPEECAPEQFEAYVKNLSDQIASEKITSIFVEEQSGGWLIVPKSRIVSVQVREVTE